MSLEHAYSLAHTAQCRLSLAASRPDRNLRFVVGHLMHYESLRLRIVEIEHDIGRDQRAKARTKHTDDQHRLRHKPSSGQLGRTSQTPTASLQNGHGGDGDEDSHDTVNDDVDDEDEDLGLMRFPSGSARPPRPPPDLEPDDDFEDGKDDEDDDEYGDEDEDEDEPVSPEEPDQQTLERTVQGKGDELYTTMYENVRNCPCHGKTDAPKIERMWKLPDGEDGNTRMVAQVAIV